MLRVLPQMNFTISTQKEMQIEKSTQKDKFNMELMMLVMVLKITDWCQKTCVFLAPIRSQNGGDRLELVW